MAEWSIAAVLKTVIPRDGNQGFESLPLLQNFSDNPFLLHSNSFYFLSIMTSGTQNLIRCFGDKPNQILYADYHDNEWGRPIFDDRMLFELLILEGAQAGLSWYTILQRRSDYKKAFSNFDPHRVAVLTDRELEELCTNSNIIRHRLKIFSVRANARVFLTIQQEYGSFAKYVWDFVNNTPIINVWKSVYEIPSCTDQSTKLSKELKKRGMTFVGPKIMYAYMQAIGMVNDHLIHCWLHAKDLK